VLLEVAAFWSGVVLLEVVVLDEAVALWSVLVLLAGGVLVVLEAAAF
jgi:hypothetical protein